MTAFEAFALLVWLKAKLVLRSFSRRRGLGGALALGTLALAFSPMWLGAAGASFAIVRKTGGAGLVVVLAATHVSWLYAAVLLGAFSEAFDLRRMLRYPIAPRTVYLLNLLATPLDIVAVVLLPPLVAAVIAVATLGGPTAAVAAALGVLLFLFVTSAVVQLLLALLADLLKHEWARAAAGLGLGALILAASFALKSASPRMGDASLSGLVVAAIEAVATTSAMVLPAVLPAGVAAAALEGNAGEALFFAGASLALGLALLWVGGRAATRAALDRETRGVAAGTSSRPRSRDAGASWLDALFDPDLAVLVGRELRVLSRTPQILVGLLTTPLLVGFFLSMPSLASGPPIYWAAFLTITPALNLSANVFGLDREGVRMLLLLPVDAARLILAKNLTIILLIAFETLVVGLLIAALDRTTPPATAITALLSVFAALPALLATGNALSIRSPWRMTFKVGGAPQGAITSAFAQLAALAATSVLLALPLAAGALFFPASPLFPIVGVLAIAVATWTTWWLLLGDAGASLLARRERILDVLCRAEETG